MRAVKTAAVWSLGTMLSPVRVLRMGFTCAADVEATVRLVVDAVENTSTEVRKSRGHISAFVVFHDPLELQAGAGLMFASANAHIPTIVS